MPCWRAKLEITPVEGDSILQKLAKIVDVLLVLALVFLKLAADYAVDLVEVDLRLDRFCRLNQNFTDQECNNMEEANFTYVKDSILKEEEDFEMKSNLIRVSISFVVVSFASSWSDRHGRIPLLKLSIVGYFLSAFIYILFTALDQWPVEVLLSASTLRGLAGGPSLFMMAVFSITVDKATLKTRTMRIGTLTNMVIVGQATGYVSGIIVRKWAKGDVFWVIFFALLLYAIALLGIAYFFKEDRAAFEARVPPRCRSSLLDFAHPKNTYDLLVVAFRKREGRGRLHLLLILWVTFFVLLSPPHLLKTWATTSLWVKPLEYSLISAASVIGCQIVTIVFLRKTRRKPVHDCLVASVSEGMTAVQDLLLIAVSRPELAGIIYFSFLFSLTHNLSNVGIRSALMKICDETEVGRVFGIMALQETIMTWTQDLIYQDLYDNTRETLPTAQHILAASFAILNTAVLLTAFVSMKREEKTTKGDEASPIVSNIVVI